MKYTISFRYPASKVQVEVPEKYDTLSEVKAAVSALMCAGMYDIHWSQVPETEWWISIEMNKVPGIFGPYKSEDIAQEAAKRLSLMNWGWSPKIVEKPKKE